MEKSYAVVPMSLAHTFGNVTAFVTEYIKNLFPKNYFNTVNISSTMAYRHFSVFETKNKNFIKKKKPMLIVRPRVDIMNNDVFMNGTLLTTRITDNFYDRDFGNLQPFIEDNKRGLHVRYLLNRIKMFFDVTIIVETQMEQLNNAMYFKNRVRQNLPFYIDTYLENNVPREIMMFLSKEVGIDINNTKQFLDYVNSHSVYPVTYKFKNSTGNDEYFRYYLSRIDAIFSDLSLEDGNKKGFVDDSYAINFTLETEFFVSALYYIFSKNKENITDFFLSIVDKKDSNSIIPIFTISAPVNIEPPEGWVLYANTLYKVESSEYNDYLDFSPLINESLKSTINYHIKNSIPINTFMKVAIYKDNELLKEDENYEINFNKLELITKKVNTTSTYRLLIYVNLFYINTLSTSLLKLEEEK